MNVNDLDVGDVVYAAKTLVNDGSMPDMAEGTVLAEEGTRGVIVRKGRLADLPDDSVFLVRFEDKDLNLGVPVGCWAAELRVEVAE